MSPTKPPDDRRILATVGRLLRSHAAQADESAHATGRARFVSAVAKSERMPVKRREPRALVVVLAAALVTVLVLSVALFFPKTTIEYSVDGARAADGGFVQAPADQVATVRFSDGSLVVLSAGARGRVRELREKGARFTVETGSVEVEVAKRPGGADYVIEAGPYAVRVTGTRFTIAWDPSTKHLHVDLTEGSIVITGPQAEGQIGLRAGQVIDMDPASVRVSEPSAASSVAPTPTPSSAPEPAGGDASAAASGPRVRGTLATATSMATASTWAERVATGDFESVLAEADARGIDATLASGTAGELMSLADAARYGGRTGLAADALRAVRKRFAGSRSASTAAFLLGRFAEDSGRAAAAISLYDSTVAEGGAFASEAMGRKMMIVERTSGAGAARPIAEQYLKSYPRGAYADAARALSSR